MNKGLPADSENDDFGVVDENDFFVAETSGGKRSLEAIGDCQSSSVKRSKTNHEDPTMSIPKTVLSKFWGFTGFRLKQAPAISRLLNGESAVVVFPTGGGKSLVYQVPALAFDEHDVHCGRPAGGGITLVVSPLIALMKDQVDALKKRGVSAAAMDSSQSRESWLDTSEKLRNGSLKLLYVAPERLNNEGFVQMISHTKIRLVAVDEAHCISEWGHAFRPDYLKIARFTREIRAERTLCLTATAAPKVVEDICSGFNIDKAGVFRTTTYRPNLRLLAQSFTNQDDKNAALVTFLRCNPGPSIHTEEVGLHLRCAGFKVDEYHAGMSNESRTSAQERFMISSGSIVVATIAFGMGIDKANIRNIVHFAIPKTLESYSQEIGRAGRDDQPSTCIVFICPQDVRLIEEWSRADVPSFRSIKGLVGEILELYKHSKAGGIIERNLNDESREWDIRKNSLDLLNAQLELRFQLFRAVTPKYSQYKYAKAPDFERKTSDGSNLAKTIKACSKSAKKWTQIDVDTAAKSAGVGREEVVRKLQQWHDCGAAELQPSGVINRFRILKEFPKSEKEKAAIIQQIYEQIKARERSDMDRVQEVIDLVTTESCISRKLAEHFGDQDSVPQAGCGHCNFCITHKPVEYAQRTEEKSISGSPVFTADEDRQIKAVLAATKVRDDARFLARIAFGISSPRVTIEKLGKNPVFGCLSEYGDFEGLVQRFAAECTDATP